MTPWRGAGYYRTMRTIITSDVHLGSRQCRVDVFAAFLEGLHSADRLVLNGDVVTRFSKEKILPPDHAAVLERLRQMSHEREIIWVRGNNDRSFALKDPGKIRFVDDYSVGQLLYITHGDRFDHLMPSLRFVLIPLRVIYEFCTRFIGSRTHVTDFAKRFPAVYRILNGHVARNAVAYASQNGFQAVACGHTHHPETRLHGGVSYYNTGCWTEDSAQMLVLEGQTLCLQPS